MLDGDPGKNLILPGNRDSGKATVILDIIRTLILPKANLCPHVMVAKPP
jgi:hypothetical protein